MNDQLALALEQLLKEVNLYNSKVEEVKQEMDTYRANLQIVLKDIVKLTKSMNKE